MRLGPASTRQEPVRQGVTGQVSTAHITGVLAALVRESAGNILPMAAMSVFVLTALVGSAVDLSRVYHAQNRLQSACDAGVLAGRRAELTNGYDGPAQTVGQRYFNANFDQAQQGTSATSLTTTTPDSGNTINGTATTTVPMLMMNLFGKTSIVLNSTCTSTMGIGNSDVTFVLDTTGSMSDTMSDGSVKITGLKAAVKNFWITLNATVASTNARVRYAFVPYSTTVNVGAALNALSPDYITNKYWVQTRVALFNTGTDIDYSNYQTWVPQTKYAYTTSNYNGYAVQYSSTSYSSEQDCLAALPSTSWINGASSTATITTQFLKNNSTQYDTVPTTIITIPQTLNNYTCVAGGGSYTRYVHTSYRNYQTFNYTTSDNIAQTRNVSTFDHFDYRFAPVDTSQYKTMTSTTSLTGDRGVGVSSTWAGCIEERATTAATSFSYNSLLNSISPSAATDLDIDSAPTSTSSTQWAPLWPRVTYIRVPDSTLISDRTGVTNNGVAYDTNGNYFAISAADYSSGGYAACPMQAKTLQPWTQSSFNSYVDTLSPNGDTYHDIGMLWGARLSSPTGIWSTLVNAAPPNQGNVARHIIYMTDGIPNSSPYDLQAYGVELNNKRITGDGTTNADAFRESRFRAICDAVKAKGIRIWVIGYTTSLTSDLSYCASPNSSYTAFTSTEINTAFQQIAKQIGELRISG